MESEHLVLVFERSAEEPRLMGVDEAVRALGENGIAVEGEAPNRGGGLIGTLMRFWFPYLSSEGVLGVTPGAGAGVTEYLVTLAPAFGSAFVKVLEGWLEGRVGRKIRVKFAGFEIEAQTPEQVESLVSHLESLRRDRKLALAGEP